MDNYNCNLNRQTIEEMFVREHNYIYYTTRTKKTTSQMSGMTGFVTPYFKSNKKVFTRNQL